MKITEYFDKSYLSKWFLSVLSGILALGIIVYAGYHIYSQFAPDLELIDATPTTVTEMISADGYIFRDEYPYYVDGNGGSIVPAIHDGGRVYLGAKLCDVYANSSPDIESRLSEIDEQIALLEGNSSSTSNRSVQSSAGVESEIYENIFTIRSHCADGNYSDALSMRTTLLVNINKRSILSGEVDYSTQISRLEAEKSSLKAQLGNLLNTLYSSTTGYYFSEYDGYGETFSSSKIDSLTYEEFVDLTSSEAESTPAGKLCAGAIVKDFRWYVACEMDKSEAVSLSDLYSSSLLFTYSDVTLEGMLYRVIPQTPGDRAVAVFLIETMPSGFDYTRMQPVRISASEYNGYEIPAEAVRVVDGFQGVYVLDEVTVEFRRINIIYQKDGVVICTGKESVITAEPDMEETDEKSTLEDQYYPWIEQNDVVIVSGRELYSGKTIS